MQESAILSNDSRQQYSLVIDGRPVEQDAAKINWNNLRCSFRPRSAKFQPPHHQQPDPSELFWGVSGDGRPPTTLAAARPKSAGFPARFHRHARRTPASTEDAENAKGHENDGLDDLTEMWRLDDEDAVELDDIFDKLTRRDADNNGGADNRKKNAKKKSQHSPQNQRSGQRSWRPRTAASAATAATAAASHSRVSKSANELYQEHLLAEIAKHRTSKSTAQRPLPPELSLFIPKTRTRLCRLYSGPCLLRGVSCAVPATPAPLNASGSGFLPIARSLAPLPAEFRPQSRQGGGGGGGSTLAGSAPGGSVQVSESACHCGWASGLVGGRRTRAATPGAGTCRGRLVASSELANGGHYCSVCHRLQMLQVA